MIPWAPVRAVFAAGLLLLAAAGISTLVLVLLKRFFAIRDLETSPGPLLRTVSGLVIIGWCGCVGGQLTRLPVGAVTGLLVVAAAVGLCVTGRSVRAAWQSRPRGLTAILRQLTVNLFVAVCVLLTLGPALCPPAGWDELVYHCVLPFRWHRDGWLQVYGDLPYSGFPGLLEILTWLVVPVEGLITPRLLTWCCWMLSLILIRDCLRGPASARAAGIMTMAIAGCPAMLMIAANCYVESLQLALTAAVLVAMRRLTGRLRIVVVAVLCGGAAGCKLTGMVCVVLPVLWILTGGSALQHEPLHRRFRRVALLFAITAATAAPFYVRPWMATGNPLHPYFAEWFDQSSVAIETSRYHHDLASSSFGMRNSGALLLGPAMLAFEEDIYDGTLGWQFIVLLLLAGAAVLIRPQRHPGTLTTQAVACVTLIFYAAWYLTAQQARFALPFALMVVVAGASLLPGLTAIWRNAVLAALLGATVISLPVRTAGYYLVSWETLGGFWSWNQYVEDGMGGSHMEMVRAVRGTVPPDQRLLILFDQRTLYPDRDATIATPFFQSGAFSPPEDYADGKRVNEALDQAAADYLLMARVPQGPDQAADWWSRLGPLYVGLKQCQEEGLLVTVWESEEYLLFRVVSHSANETSPDVR